MGKVGGGLSRRPSNRRGRAEQTAEAPKPAPLAPPVTQEAQRSTASNTGRATGDILDPVMANEEENKQVLG